jgi:site-specific DNA-methyltransferase (adenine-specific)
MRANIELHNVDCMDYLRSCEDKAFELAIVDPPYGIDINSSGRLGHYGGRGKKWDADTPGEDYFKELRRISVNQIVWGGNYFSLPPTRCFLIWDKQQPPGVSFASCEYAWTSFDASAKTHYQRPQGADVERIHPTQKPVKLYEWLLDNYAKEGDRILDTHLGSGSIALACWNRRFDLVGCELDPDYFAAATKRLNKHKQQLQMF